METALNDDILTVPQVAELTHRHEETITLALRKKELRGSQRKKGGRWFVRRDDAISWAFGESVDDALAA